MLQGSDDDVGKKRRDTGDILVRQKGLGDGLNARGNTGEVLIEGESQAGGLHCSMRPFPEAGNIGGDHSPTCPVLVSENLSSDSHWVQFLAWKATSDQSPSPGK